MAWIKEIDILVDLCSYLSFYKAQVLTFHCQEARIKAALGSISAKRVACSCLFLIEILCCKLAVLL